jgi:hypothetical protein
MCQPKGAIFYAFREFCGAKREQIIRFGKGLAVSRPKTSPFYAPHTFRNSAGTGDGFRLA